MSVTRKSLVEHCPDYKPPADAMPCPDTLQNDSRKNGHQLDEYHPITMASSNNSMNFQIPISESSARFSSMVSAYDVCHNEPGTPIQPFDNVDHFTSPQILTRQGLSNTPELMFYEGLQLYNVSNDGSPQLPHTNRKPDFTNNPTSQHTRGYVQNFNSAPLLAQPSQPSESIRSVSSYLSPRSELSKGILFETPKYVAPSLYSTMVLQNDKRRNLNDQSANSGAPLPASRRGELLEELATQCTEDLDSFLNHEQFELLTSDESSRFVKVQGYDDELSKFLELDDSTLHNNTNHRNSNLAFLPNSTMSQIHPHNSNEFSASGSPGKLPKSAKMSKSSNLNNEGPDGPAFSLEDCSIEFHLKDGNFAFQDETAEVQKRHSTTSLQKRSSSKLIKSSTKPPLRKAKTVPNFGRLLLKNSGQILKNMESGLLSFQLPFNDPMNN